MGSILKTPLILINFKTYLEGTGKEAFRLAKIAERVSLETGVQIIVTPQYSDISKIATKTKIPVFAQHVDSEEAGAHTGNVLPEAILAAGAVGTLLNHAEKPLTLDRIDQSIKRCKGLGLISCVLANAKVDSAKIARLRPEMMVVELPELIGSGSAISTVKPEVVTNVIKEVRKVNRDVILLAGSGISTKKDAARAIELGMQGVGSSKAVMKAENPREVLSDMADALMGSENS